ncbi:hypothetical protein FHS61_002496 [Altererythrobacter atlanticus]|uniref:Molybdenum cofactor biosynthesis protein F n=1 Tax=Croceibacterium atlanticum TaxID=1267766 RepID=A0A0F7KS73_9SPHN|nr:MoaF N-terminal domain-containing protein [Croceibacterium atlanticum]AKH41971.1 Molybdenum cofactor biosynthesis protein F [Croceibacterium atlanticum]MBB5733461.1 hypothetical protein [Croceibacterium atlanticum]
MARQAYPDVPLFRYDYTDLDKARIAQALAAPAQAGPASRSELDDRLAGTTLTIITEDAGPLSWQFRPGRRLAFDGKECGYGALALGHVTLIAHLVPGTTTGFAIAWDRDNGLATVFELWFGDGPAPVAREVNRAIHFGKVENTPATQDRHQPTARVEGRALSWTEDTGNRTIDYYPSAMYSHWVELDRLNEGRGYSAPSDYIQLTEDIYAYTRTESEFSGLWHMYLMDMNRLESVGLRLGFNGADELEYYMFRGTGEWLGQIARFEEFGDVSGDPIKIENGKKGERRIYRPLQTMPRMTPEQVAAAVARGPKIFDGPSIMAGNGLPPSKAMAGRNFTVRYDAGPVMEYRITGPDRLEWRKDGSGGWTGARYNAWETMPGVFIFGHFLEGSKDHDGHIVVADFESGMATCFHGYLNTPFFANEAGAETWFGKLEGAEVPDPGGKRHERTMDMIGRAFTWNYSPGLTSMHVYSTPNTVSWVIFTPDGHGGTEWSGTGDFIKIRDQLYFCRWQEEACNGTLGTILINMRTMHDSGIGYHCGEEGLSISAIGAFARHAGKIDVDKFFGGKA